MEDRIQSNITFDFKNPKSSIALVKISTIEHTGQSSKASQNIRCLLYQYLNFINK
jgi:hypothetical protein